MIVVTGPRIDPALQPAYDGLEIRPYGCCMDCDAAAPADIAAAIASEICRDVDYRPVATDGAALAAAMLDSLL